MLPVAIFVCGIALSACGNGEEEYVPSPCICSWSEWTITAAPTCTTEGSRERECLTCQEKETEAIPIDPDAHDHVWQVYREPIPGHWEGIEELKCTHCGHVKEWRYFPHGG